MHYVYLLESTDQQYLKIGISSCPKQRHASLRNKTPFGFVCVWQIKTETREQAKQIEAEIKGFFRSERAFPMIRGKNHADYFSGVTEWFKSNHFTRAMLRVLFREYAQQFPTKQGRASRRLLKSFPNHQRWKEHRIVSEATRDQPHPDLIA